MLLPAAHHASPEMRFHCSSCVTLCVRVQGAGHPCGVAYSLDFLLSGWEDGSLRCVAHPVRSPSSDTRTVVNTACCVLGGDAAGAITRTRASRCGPSPAHTAAACQPSPSAKTNGSRYVHHQYNIIRVNLLQAVRVCASVGVRLPQVSGGNQGEVRLWELRSRELVSDLKEHILPVTQVVSRAASSARLAVCRSVHGCVRCARCSCCTTMMSTPCPAPVTNPSCAGIFGCVLWFPLARALPAGGRGLASNRCPPACSVCPSAGEADFQPHPRHGRHPRHRTHARSVAGHYRRAGQEDHVRGSVRTPALVCFPWPIHGCSFASLWLFCRYWDLREKVPVQVIDPAHSPGAEV